MSTTPQNDFENQEIDLITIFKSINRFFENISLRIFKGILFLKRNLIWLGILFVIGAGIGFYLDKNTKKYENQVIVTPNFDSVDYLYAKIQLINSKIIEGDTVYLKNTVGIQKPKEFLKINITPITDIYKFIDWEGPKLEVLKLMAESGDVNKIITDETTSRNYENHLISYITKGKTSEEATLIPILNFLNESDYFTNIKKIELENIKTEMAHTDTIISQINKLLNSYNNTVNSSSRGDKLVYYNENTQLNNIFKTKDSLVSVQSKNKLTLAEKDKVVKNKSEVLNIRNKENVNGKFKFILPLLFVFVFLFIGVFKSYYRKQMAKLNS